MTDLINIVVGPKSQREKKWRNIRWNDNKIPSFIHKSKTKKCKEFLSFGKYNLLPISDIFMLCLFRSHDGFQEKSDGVLEPAGGSSYASQRRVFEDLGQGVLDNAFEGNKSFR